MEREGPLPLSQIPGSAPDNRLAAEPKLIDGFTD